MDDFQGRDFAEPPAPRIAILNKTVSPSGFGVVARTATIAPSGPFSAD